MSKLNLTATCLNLIQTNNGFFKSEKQKNLFHNAYKNSIIVDSKDTFKFDQNGLVEYVSNNAVKWNRVVEAQADDSTIENILLKKWEASCIKTWGYVIHMDKLNQLEDILEYDHNAVAEQVLNDMSLLDAYQDALVEHEKMVAYYNDILKKIEIFKSWAVEKYNFSKEISFLKR